MALQCETCEAMVGNRLRASTHQVPPEQCPNCGEYAIWVEVEYERESDGSKPWASIVRGVRDALGR